MNSTTTPNTMQAKRRVKAIEEGKSYSFYRADAGTIFVHNPRTCTTYTLRKTGERSVSCDCPDFAQHGETVLCKHLLAASHYRAEIQPLPPVPAPKPRPAFDVKRFEAIFG